MLSALIANLLSPAVMFFALGLAAACIKSDLKLPKGLTDTLGIYLLIAIGLKGGIELSKYSPAMLLQPMAAGIGLSLLIPVVAFFTLRRLRLDRFNSAAMAAAYGSVSVVTFGAAVDFLDGRGIAYDSYMSAVMAVMELPSLIVALLLLRLSTQRTDKPASASEVPHSPAYRSPYRLGIVDSGLMKETLAGKSVLLLSGSLLIGTVSGQEALPIVEPFFFDLYRGVLLIFLLAMGIKCGEQLSALRQGSVVVLMFALLSPIVFGTLGVLVGAAADMSAGSAALLGVLAASASYIAAPAALKSSIPEASPSIYLGSALGITFPLNLTLGIPYCAALASAIMGSI